MSRWTALQHLLQTAVLMLAVTGGATLLLTGYRFVLEPVSQLKRAIERLRSLPPDPAAAPLRIFGLSSLAPVQVRLLQALGRVR